jgi:hypothetical protein
VTLSTLAARSGTAVAEPVSKVMRSARPRAATRAGDLDLRGGQVDADDPPRPAGLHPVNILVREADVEEPVAGAERGRRGHEPDHGLAGVVDGAGLPPVARRS